jgi:2-polyprenyl-6-hydroxyphenyl methylase/3-demethylubiquinone-9 3-methyltransferase
MDDDQITRLYRGEIMTPEAQRRCRERIAWITQRASGPRVLDVGCSQGIVSILLARRGLECLAVDIAEPQIRYARQALADEPPAVRERIRFELTDVRRIDCGPFDTAILGEVLEHDDNPEKLLAVVKDLVRPEGKVIITVPYGHQPSADHKRSYYLAGFHDVVRQQFQIRELGLLNRNIVCLASPEGAAETLVLDEGHVAQVERIVAELEQEVERIKGRLKAAARPTQKPGGAAQLGRKLLRKVRGRLTGKAP